MPAYALLQGHWDNFLLGCVNCNSTKKDKEVIPAECLLPDRDNTAAAYAYTMDGLITLQSRLTPQQREMALRTLSLTGLDKRIHQTLDSNGELVAADRVAQRMEVRLIATESKSDLQANPSQPFRKQIVRTAVGHGFFSIWMTVFYDDSAVRKLLIEEFAGTALDCFDPVTTEVVSPRPIGTLPFGGKV